MITSNLDPEINPADDFYGYACGGWQKANPLRADYSRYGVFDKISDTAGIQLREMIEGLEKHPEVCTKDSIAQKVNDIYRLGMDIERRNSEGAAPLKPIIKRINDLTPETLYDTLAWLHRGAGGGFFGFGVGPDPEDADINILHVTECGLMLGDRDYYLVESEENAKILAAYHDYVVKIMQLSGYSENEAERVWQSVIEIETAIAKNKKTREERRNPLLSHNSMAFSDFVNKFPNIEWNKVFTGAGLKPVDTLNVSSLKFIEFINHYLPTLIVNSIQKVKDYLTLTAISEATGLLSEDFQKADFELYGKAMAGQEEMKPLWKRVISIPNSMFGEAVGQLYVEKYFPDSHKKAMLTLVENLRIALAQHIKNLPWLSKITKNKALDKLNSLKVKIGYPDKWKDYSGIHIDPSRSYHANVLAAAEWFVQDGYSRLGKPVDKEEWFMTPQTVNAYYSPSMNEICFPAAILQPPYFQIDTDAPSNYGAIGVVIGHEMTHGFDDQGRQFDAKGNLSNWWTKEDENQFNELADRLVDQFDKVEVAPGVKANGRFTLGENIADQGGIRIALTALENAKEGHLSNEDLKNFFLSYAGVWASNIRPEAILARTKTDPHSLERNRVNVTLKNIEPFYDAFNIKEGDEMYLNPDERVLIW